MNKKLILLFTFFIMLFSYVYAANPITVQLNGQYINFEDENGNIVNPEMMNNRTMVPMRKIFEVVGAEIEWNGEERKITATTDTKIIKLQIDNVEAVLIDIETNTEEKITLDAAPVILNNRTMVPVRFIAESLEKQVGWDNENRCVVIIDYAFIEEGLNEYASGLVEFLKMEKESLDSFKISTDISGVLNYRDEEERDYNEKVNFDGEVEIKKNKDGIILTEFELETKGKGEIQKALEKMGYNDLEYKCIINGETTYIKSSIYDTKKWKKSDSEMKLSFEMDYTYDEYLENLKIPENELNVNSYNLIQNKLEETYAFYGNDKFHLKGASNKTFVLSVDIAEVLNQLAEEKMNQLLAFLALGSVNLNVEFSFEKETLEEVEITIDFYLENAEDAENTKVKIELESKIQAVNSNIKLTMPKASEIEKGE